MQYSGYMVDLVQLLAPLVPFNYVEEDIRLTLARDGIAIASAGFMVSSSDIVGICGLSVIQIVDPNLLLC